MSLQNLYKRYAVQLPPAELVWIGLRPGRKEPMQSVQGCLAIAERGLEGDHRTSKTPGSARQVTLISEEFIASIAGYTGLPNIDPSQLRRNLVVRGINLNALRYQQFQLGDAVFQATALCHPCSRMEETVGPGTVSAMMGYGGLCCKVLQSGEIALGDRLQLLDSETTPL